MGEIKKIRKQCRNCNNLFPQGKINTQGLCPNCANLAKNASLNVDEDEEEEEEEQTNPPKTKFDDYRLQSFSVPDKEDEDEDEYQ